MTGTGDADKRRLYLQVHALMVTKSTKTARSRQGSPQNELMGEIANQKATLAGPFTIIVS